MHILQLISLEKKKKKEDEVELSELDEPVVIDLTKSYLEKKVKQRRIKNNEHKIRSAKTARMPNVRFIHDVSFERRNYSLILYQEICV